MQKLPNNLDKFQAVDSSFVPGRPVGQDCVQPEIFKIKLSIWVCSLWFTDDRFKFECDNLRGT